MGSRRTELEAKLEDGVTFLVLGILTALDITNDDYCILAEFLVLAWLNKLEEHVDRRLVLLKGCAENKTHVNLLAWLELGIAELLDRFVFFILNEWLKRPSHFRLILHSEF